MDSGSDRRTRWGDALCAFALAAIMSLAWAWRDWSDLTALRLPDTDDMMRLQQIRDWLGGQAFSDLAQHRLGPAPGLAMHWSRLADLVPGGIIAALTPLIGVHVAEMTAVILWPAALFGVALLLVTRIARAIGGSEIARTALIVAAIAYPVTTIFVPGRIDHHGLQIVLLLLIARTLVAGPSMGHGLVAGLAATGSLVIGLETAPLIAAAGAAMTIEWIATRHGADDRMMGFGISLGAGLLFASIVFRSDQWTYAACDGFTAVLWRGALVAAFAPMLMALAARDVTRPVARTGLAFAVSAVIGGGIVLVAPQCLSPYGAVDPILAKLWLGRVGEAQPLFAAPLGIAIGYAGVMVAGIAASGWRFHATRDARWAALLLVQAAALALTCYQLRGAYGGAILAAPGLAAVIAAARTRGAGWMAGAWIASAGMLYPLAAGALVPGAPTPAAQPRGGDCTAPGALALLRTLPAGRMIAPLDLGAYAIGSTGLTMIGAPYHRNDAGNLASYRFFLGDEVEARTIAQKWQVTYVVYCPGSFSELGTGMTAAPRMIGRLMQDKPPAWLVPVVRSDALVAYRVEPGLLDRSRSR
ncbi:MAG TPA: hypothetical protein VK980_11000 [Sphingomonas sp.]|nr:hypothetical protein [Sphingomonas sp.]